MSIRLHPEHGLNPTMPCCFFCGKPTGEIALLGAKLKERAPMYMVLNYEPCHQCQQMRAKGITLIEVSTKPQQQDQPPINKTDATPPLYPTGKWAVMTEEAFIRNVSADGDGARRAAALKHRCAFVAIGVLPDEEINLVDTDNTDA